MEKFGFEKVNWETAIQDIAAGYYCQKESLAVLEMKENFSEKEIRQAVLEQEPGCQYILAFWKENEIEKLLFYSRKKIVRALEFLDYLISEFGLVRGDGQCAQGEISLAILGVLVGQQESEGTAEYFLEKAESYFLDGDWVEAGSYVSENEGILESMEVYQKKMVKWAYVRSLDVVEKGQKLCIKSLENESGLVLEADEDTYIMIGCRGEIYDITREKFESTYEPTQESLDIFEQMLDFIPVLETVPEGEYISLDEAAHLCQPKKGRGIYARQLEKRTKVFSGRDEQVYFLGRPGDYLAVRRDDVKDIYIIQKEVFAQTYEKV